MAKEEDDDANGRNKGREVIAFWTHIHNTLVDSLKLHMLHGQKKKSIIFFW